MRGAVPSATNKKIRFFFAVPPLTAVHAADAWLGAPLALAGCVARGDIKIF